MWLEKINFNQKNVLDNLNRFFHHGISFEDHHEKLEIIEKALNRVHGKFISAIREGSTHCHKKNMINAYGKLIGLYRIEFIHDSGDYYNTCLKEACLKRFERNEDLIKEISGIVNMDGFSHREHRLLLKPYLFDFENDMFIYSMHGYRERRQDLETKLKELVIEWMSEEKEIESLINEEVLKIVKK